MKDSQRQLSYKAFREKFQNEFSKALEKYRQDLASTGVLLSHTDSHASFIDLWAGSSEMDWCNLADKGPSAYTGDSVWCSDHDMPASHCGTDGDTPVCVIHAQASGCNCCPINYDDELRKEVKARFGNRVLKPKPEGELELLRRVRVILDDLFGMHRNDAQELIDELRDAGIGFRNIEEE